MTMKEQNETKCLTAVRRTFFRRKESIIWTQEYTVSVLYMNYTFLFLLLSKKNFKSSKKDFNQHHVWKVNNLIADMKNWIQEGNKKILVRQSEKCFRQKNFHPNVRPFSGQKFALKQNFCHLNKTSIFSPSLLELNTYR